MIMTLKTSNVLTLDQIRAFLDGSQPFELQIPDRQQAYAFIADTLRSLRMRLTGNPLMMKTVKSRIRFASFCHRQTKRRYATSWNRCFEAADNPVSDFDIHPFAQNEVEIFARLLATSVDSKELDRVVDQLTAMTSVSQAFWSPSTTA